MGRRDAYLFKAAELNELARNSRYATLKAQFESLARAYLRLSDEVKEYEDKIKEHGHEIPPTDRPAKWSLVPN